jgi:cyclopropane-fatty-acyl-phospholipid synthase
MSNALNRAIGWTEAGLVPDSVIRAGIRRLIRRRLDEINQGGIENVRDRVEAFITLMGQSEIAPVPHLANHQHYELPAEFFGTVLGRHGKYSCGFWDEGTASLDQAEADALRITCERAGIEDGMEVLDLGCGWGSLSLWIAQRYPGCKVTAVSNSATQRRWIEARAAELCLDQVRVITADMNSFSIDQRFDRIVSVEMFEHMRNYPELFRRISGWLAPGGRFFMHIFCHRNCAYEFVDQGPGDWMGRHFFSGGIMPSADLPLRFQRHLQLLEQHAWSGAHYERTAEAWLEKLDHNRSQLKAIFVETYGADHAEQWLQRWRIFFMACAELFACNNGQEWFVGHYLFSGQSA